MMKFSPIRHAAFWAFLLLLCGLLTVALGSTLPRINSRLLTPALNEISNPSFEAERAGGLVSWTVSGPSENVRTVTGRAPHGAAYVEIGTAGQSAGVQQTLRAYPEYLYELSAWLQATVHSGGTAALSLEFLNRHERILKQAQVEIGGDAAGWQQYTVQATAPAGTHMARVGVVCDGELVVHADAMRLFAPRLRTQRVRPSAVRDMTVERLRPNSLTLAWTAPDSCHEVLVRRKGVRRATWESFGTTCTTVHTVLSLQPETAYELKLREILPPYYDEKGHPVLLPPHLPETEVITVTTPAWSARRFAAMRLWPSKPLDTFTGSRRFPSIEQHQGLLYVVESLNNALYLSCIDPDGYAVKWTQEWVTMPEDFGEIAGTDLCVIGDMLYLMYRVVFPSATPGLERGHLVLTAFDLQANAPAEETTRITAHWPDGAIESGGLGAVQNQLWLAWQEARTAANDQRTGRIMLAPVTDEGPGEAIEWEESPTDYPYGVSLNLFSDEFIVLFSDRAAAKERHGFEPLWAVRFNGRRFHHLQRLTNFGQSHEARGIQVGTNFFALYGTDVSHSFRHDMRQDIAVLRIGSGGQVLEGTLFVDDFTINTHPDVAVTDSKLHVVYTKSRFARDTHDDSPANLGTFIGLIDFAGGDRQ